MTNTDRESPRRTDERRNSHRRGEHRRKSNVPVDSDRRRLLDKRQGYQRKYSRREEKERRNK